MEPSIDIKTLHVGVQIGLNLSVLSYVNLFSRHREWLDHLTFVDRSRNQTLAMEPYVKTIGYFELQI